MAPQALGFAAVLIVVTLGGDPTDTPTVNEKIVGIAKKHVGKQVGDGECWTLADRALRAAGAKSSPAYSESPDRGDYVWGELVFGRQVKDAKVLETGNSAKLRPGDIVQFRDAHFAGKLGQGSYEMTAPHHTAIVSAVNADGRTLRILQQNFDGNKTVAEAPLHVNHLRDGWIKIYRPAPE